MIQNPKYGANSPNILYVPGYQDSPHSATTQLVIDAYFKLGGYNVFALEWPANVAYPIAVANAFEVFNQTSAFSDVIEMNFSHFVEINFFVHLGRNEIG